MNSSILIPLRTAPEQTARLLELQAAFADVCNAIAPIVQQSRCWNRVGLHHMVYRSMRERFPRVGSQMVCNAIYSVSRTCRTVYQSPNSPVALSKRPGQPLPLLRFLSNAPVYFDRHTLSLKNRKLSMYTLDGRMQFALDLDPADEARFHTQKLREIVLGQNSEGFHLIFEFVSASGDEPNYKDVANELPEYLLVTTGESAGMTEPRQLEQVTG